MSKTDFINISESEINRFADTVKTVYELEQSPTIPQLPDSFNLSRNVDFHKNEVKGTFASALNFTGIDISTNSEWEYHVVDFTISTTILGDIEGPVMSATYGVGCRIVLQIKKTDLDISIDLAQLAAQSQLGLVKVNVALHLKGFGTILPDVPDGLFTFQKFTMDKYTKINTLINNVENLLTDTSKHSTFDPVLLGVSLKRLYTDDVEDIFESGNYALWRIKKSSSLEKAIENADKYSIKIDKEIVRRVYALILQRPPLAIEGAEALPIGKSKPGNSEQARARDLLVKYRMLSKKDGME